MSMATLSEIDRTVSQLPEEEQLLLIERVIHRLRRSTPGQATSGSNPLAAMAEDPDIQREIQAINSEFSRTELDGLV